MRCWAIGRRARPLLNKVVYDGEEDADDGHRQKNFISLITLIRNVVVAKAIHDEAASH